MSRKYKFYESGGMYFVSFATVNWIAVFIRVSYLEILTSSLTYCMNNFKMQIYSYCVMPNHVHLIFSSPLRKPMECLREYKRYTSQAIKTTILENTKESRQEWLNKLLVTKNEKSYQLWQHHNKPIQLYTHKVIKQKLDYIHLNPVRSGFVLKPEHWRFSSAMNYEGQQGEIEIEILQLNNLGIGKIIGPIHS